MCWLKQAATSMAYCQYRTGRPAHLKRDVFNGLCNVLITSTSDLPS